MLQRQMHRAKLSWGRRQPRPGKNTWQGPPQQQSKGRQHGMASSQFISSWHLLYCNVFRSMTAMAQTHLLQAMQGVARLHSVPCFRQPLAPLPQHQQFSHHEERPPLPQQQQQSSSHGAQSMAEPQLAQTRQSAEGRPAHVARSTDQPQQQQVQHQQQQKRRVREDENTVIVRGNRYTKLECVGRGGSSKVFKVILAVTCAL